MHLKSVAGSLISAAILLAASALGAADGSPQSAAPPSNPYGRVYPARIYRTVKLQGPAPVIDGRLDDPAWNEGEWAGDYRQFAPTEGASPSQRTELKILYDETNVYVAIRAHDEMAKVHRYSGLRDEMVGDIVGVCFDSYFDKRTGFEFDLTAAGGKIDLVLTNDNADTNWNAVWDGKTAFEEGAWTAEMRIPLSQLRYGPNDEQVWGLHAWRWIDRNQEEDQWNLIPRNSSGRMYNLGELHGIHGIRRFRHVELMPYSMGRIVADPRVAGDPYHSGPRTLGAAGLDAKVGLTTDITLDATVNPDFGQVEADPSVMNLTAYETFYDEKRPFFLEGRSILDFTGGEGQLFYSRRIGHAPGYAPELADGEFMRTPDHTSILGAVKVTGKTRGGLSLGVVASLTGAETAQIWSQGQERRQGVEPAANYFVARVQKDWDKGNTSLGAIVSSTHRWISDQALAFMAHDAVTGGVDFVHYFAKRTYSIAAKLVVSDVRGSTDAIQSLETNAVHYYQRPDATHLGLDPNATSLSGHGGQITFARQGASKWSFSESLLWMSPGLELNDVGYLQRADLIRNRVSVTYKETQPHGILREFGAYAEHMDAWDFGGLRLDGSTSVNLNFPFKNKWGAQAGATLAQEPVDTRLLRGGPGLKLSRYFCTWEYVNTDRSKPVSFAFNFHTHLFPENRSHLLQLTPDASLRLSNAFTFSAYVDYTRNSNATQYVATAETDQGSRYIVGKIDQKTLNATVRVNLHLTPELSVQYYGSPFVSIGKYTDLKRVVAPRAGIYEQRFQPFLGDQITARPDGSTYDVAEGPGAQSYSFTNPDFSFRQFRSNLVLRWEYRPGSTLYAVWSQGRTSNDAVWEGSLARNYSALWRTEAQNVFLVKLTYWFSM